MSGERRALLLLDIEPIRPSSTEQDTNIWRMIMGRLIASQPRTHLSRVQTAANRRFSHGRLAAICDFASEQKVVDCGKGRKSKAQHPPLHLC